MLKIYHIKLTISLMSCVYNSNIIIVIIVVIGILSKHQ